MSNYTGCNIKQYVVKCRNGVSRKLASFLGAIYTGMFCFACAGCHHWDGAIKFRRPYKLLVLEQGLKGRAFPDLLDARVQVLGEAPDEPEGASLEVAKRGYSLMV